MRLRTALATAALAILVAERPASAQSSGDVALAEQLFQEAQALFREKRYAEACPKFEESQRLDPGGGTLFQLATCHALTGKTASAWAEFREVALLAKQRGRPDIEQAASEESRSLEAKLSHLVIVVSDEATHTEGLSVHRDGSVLGAAALGTAMPVDPGPHEISAEAPGRNTWSVSVVVAPDGDLKSVTVPGLAVSPTPEPVVTRVQTTPVTREVHMSKHSPALLYGTLGIGVVGVALATFFGVESYVKERDARDKCPHDPCSDAAGVKASTDGVTYANVANVAGATGIVALGVTTYLLLTNRAGASSKPKAALQMTPSSVSPLSLGVEGRF